MPTAVLNDVPARTATAADAELAHAFFPPLTLTAFPSGSVLKINPLSMLTLADPTPQQTLPIQPDPNMKKKCNR
jgi:hypothetical protein